MLQLTQNKRMKKRYIIILVILLGLIVLAIIEYRMYISPKGIKIDKTKYPITGIDISKHSGIIDWDKIKKQQINFVYIKATEGQDYVDPNYYINLTRAQKAKITVGEYHFFRFNKSGKVQAQNFLSHALHDPNELPTVVDIEEWGNLPVYKSDAEIKKEIRLFLIEVQSVIHRKMVIYTNMDSYNRYIKGGFPNNPIWICTFNKTPKLPDNRNWLFWQHAHNGKLAGIKVDVDINTFNGNESEWKAFVSTLKQ